MRGKVILVCNLVLVFRITPAYAGKSIMSCSFSGFVEDHPRLCGEKSQTMPRDFAEKGSPPPMRGKDGFEYFNVKQIRITPAYAGKSSCGLLSRLYR